MTRRKRIRRFIITVEEVVDDSLGIEHQEPPPMQTRDPVVKEWFGEQTPNGRREKRVREMKQRAAEEAAEAARKAEVSP